MLPRVVGLGHGLEQAADDFVGIDAFAGRRKIAKHAVAQDGQDVGADVVAGDVDAALEKGVGLGGEEKILTGARRGRGP